MNFHLFILSAVIATYSTFATAAPGPQLTQPNNAGSPGQKTLKVTLDGEERILPVNDLQGLFKYPVSRLRLSRGGFVRNVLWRVGLGGSSAIESINNAVVTEVPAGTSNYKCFFHSSAATAAEGRISDIFGTDFAMPTPIALPDQLCCYDFVREKAHVLIGTDSVDLAMIEVDVVDSIGPAVPNALSGGEMVVVREAVLLADPGYDSLCFFLEGGVLDFDSIITFQSPLAIGLNPSASSIICTARATFERQFPEVDVLPP